MPTVLSAQEERGWGAYIQASIRLQTRLDEQLRDRNGITLIDYHLLMLLSRAPQRRLRMSELADRMAFSRSRITYQVTSMEKRGLVVREAAPDDGRGYRAVLTPTGLATLRRAAPTHAASVRELFLDNLDGDELGCVESVFTRLLAQLGNDGTDAS